MFTSVAHQTVHSYNKLPGNGSVKKHKMEKSRHQSMVKANIEEEPAIITTDERLISNNSRQRITNENVAETERTDDNASINRQKSRKNSKISLGKTNEFIFKEKIKRSSKNDNYRKTKKTEFLYYQYLFNTFLQCVFSLNSILSAILAYEFEYGDITKGLNIALWFSFISSVCLWVTILYEYFINCKILSINKNLPEKIWRKERGNLITLIFTLIISFLHPNPAFIGFNVEIYNEKFHVNGVHSINSLFTVICLLRMWYFVKFYLVYSDYYSPRTHRICQMNNFDTNLTFSMKASMIKTPYHAYLLLFIIVLVYCSYCLRIFERVLDDVSGKNFSSYWNSVWCLIITMTTVGYGDYFPSSLLGRTIGIISCICGVFLISMLIVTITNLLNFQGTEENVFLILQRLKLTKEKDQLAAKLITKYMSMLNNIKNSHNKEELINSQEKLKEDILLGLYYFKEKNAEIEATFPAYSNFDIVVDNLDMLDASMTNLKMKYAVLESHIEQISKKISS